MVEKYGKDRVVQIVTFGTMAAKGVIRDVGRVMDLPYSLCDSIAKMIPAELNITIEKALKTNRELKSLYETDETVKTLIDTSLRLEGLPRHTSMHAAGVVISQKPVEEYVPLSRAQDGTITTQFTMTTLEELGPVSYTHLITRHFIELRGIGIIDVKTLFGVESVKNTQSIDMVIKLEEWDRDKEYDRLGLDDQYTEFLGNKVICHSIPIRPGRNLAIIVESAAVNYRQKKMGYNAAQELYKRVQDNLARGAVDII